MSIIKNKTIKIIIMNLKLNKYEEKLVVYALREVGKEAAKKNNELTLMNVSNLLNKMENK